MEQSGGHLDVESRPGRGTTFTVLLPRAAHQPAAEPSVAAAASSRRGHETILIVDDSSALRLVFSKVIEGAGYDVLVAPDGFAALEVAEAHAGPIDLLLTDVVMPRMSGRELYEQLGTRDPDLRVVFSSGYARDDVLRYGIEDGRFSFVQKPISNDELLERIREELDRGARDRR